jgi:L-rhamnose mutarotase
LKVFDLAFSPDYYYIKRSTIVEKISFNNRTFYAKFERIDEPLTPLILKQHFHREYTIAVPLVKNDTTNYLVIEYKGEEYQRFFHLVKHLFKTLNIENYHIYEGKDAERLQVFIEVNQLTLEDADTKLQKLSDALKEKMTKKWKCLPSASLPEEYNIVTLPYKKI